MTGALFDIRGAPIDNDVAVPFDGPNGVAVTYPLCRLLVGSEDACLDAPPQEPGTITVDLTYAVPHGGGTISTAHLAHLVAVSDRFGRIAFFAHSSTAIETAIGQVLAMSGGGAT